MSNRKLNITFDCLCLKRITPCMGLSYFLNHTSHNCLCPQLSSGKACLQVTSIDGLWDKSFQGFDIVYLNRPWLYKKRGAKPLPPNGGRQATGGDIFPFSCFLRHKQLPRARAILLHDNWLSLSSSNVLQIFRSSANHGMVN